MTVTLTAFDIFLLVLGALTFSTAALLLADRAPDILCRLTWRRAKRKKEK